MRVRAVDHSLEPPPAAANVSRSESGRGRRRWCLEDAGGLRGEEVLKNNCSHFRAERLHPKERRGRLLERQRRVQQRNEAHGEGAVVGEGRSGGGGNEKSCGC